MSRANVSRCGLAELRVLAERLRRVLGDEVPPDDRAIFLTIATNFRA